MCTCWYCLSLSLCQDTFFFLFALLRTKEGLVSIHVCMYVQCTCACAHTHTHTSSPLRVEVHRMDFAGGYWYILHQRTPYAAGREKKDTHKTQDMMSSALHDGDCCMQSTCITGIVYLFLAMYVHDWRISITSILLETCNTQNFITLYEFTRATSTLLKFQLAKPTCMYTVHVLVITS